jgi:hypothetical protein
MTTSVTEVEVGMMVKLTVQVDNSSSAAPVAFEVQTEDGELLDTLQGPVVAGRAVADWTVDVGDRELPLNVVFAAWRGGATTKAGTLHIKSGEEAYTTRGQALTRADDSSASAGLSEGEAADSAETDEQPLGDAGEEIGVPDGDIYFVGQKRTIHLDLASLQVRPMPLAFSLKLTFTLQQAQDGEDFNDVPPDIFAPRERNVHPATKTVRAHFTVRTHDLPRQHRFRWVVTVEGRTTRVVELPPFSVATMVTVRLHDPPDIVAGGREDVSHGGRPTWEGNNVVVDVDPPETELPNGGTVDPTGETAFAATCDETGHLSVARHGIHATEILWRASPSEIELTGEHTEVDVTINTRKRLSLWTAEAIFPMDGAVMMNPNDPRFEPTLAATLDRAQGHLDDISLLRTVNIDASNNAGWDHGEAASGSSAYLPGVPTSDGKRMVTEMLIRLCHERGIQLLVGYGIVTPGTAPSPRGNRFLQMIRNPAVRDAHVESLVAFLDAQVPDYDGISFDLEINGTHRTEAERESFRAFYAAVAENLAKKNKVVTFAAGASTSRAEENAAHGLFFAQAYRIAVGIPNLIVRPMAYDGPSSEPEEALYRWHERIADYAIDRNESEPNPGGLLHPAQLQMGLKVVVPTARSVVTRAGLLRRAGELLRPRRVGLIIYHYNRNIIDREGQRIDPLGDAPEIDASLNPGECIPPDGILGQPNQVPLDVVARARRLE